MSEPTPNTTSDDQVDLGYGVELVSDWPTWLGSDVWGATWAGIGIVGVVTQIILTTVLGFEISDPVELNLSRLACLTLAAGHAGALGWWICILPVASQKRMNPFEADPVGPLVSGIGGVMAGGAWRGMDWPLDVGIGVIVTAGVLAATSQVPLRYAATAAVAAAGAVLFDGLPPALRAQVLTQEPWLLLGLIGVAVPVAGLPMVVVRTGRRIYEGDLPLVALIGPVATMLAGLVATAWLLHPLLPFANLAF